MAGKNSRTKKEHNSLRGLLTGKAVCAGYTLILKQALSCVGIESKWVNNIPDDLTKTYAHAWNQVKIDGKWYNTDLTEDRYDMNNGKIPEQCLKSDDFGYYKALGTNNSEEKCIESFPKSELMKYMFPEKSLKRNIYLFSKGQSSLSKDDLVDKCKSLGLDYDEEYNYAIEKTKIEEEIMEHLMIQLEDGSVSYNTSPSEKKSSIMAMCKKIGIKFKEVVAECRDVTQFRNNIHQYSEDEIKDKCCDLGLDYNFEIQSFNEKDIDEVLKTVKIPDFSKEDSIETLAEKYIEYVKAVERERGLTDEKIYAKYAHGQCYELALGIENFLILMGKDHSKFCDSRLEKCKTPPGKVDGHHYLLKLINSSKEQVFYDIYGKHSLNELEYMKEHYFTDEHPEVWDIRDNMTEYEYEDEWDVNTAITAHLKEHYNRLSKEGKIDNLKKQMEWFHKGQTLLTVKDINELCSEYGLDFNTEMQHAKQKVEFDTELDEYCTLGDKDKQILWNQMSDKAAKLGLILKDEIYLAEARLDLRDRMHDFQLGVRELDIKEIDEECTALRMNFNEEMEKAKEDCENPEWLRKEYKKDLDLYTQGKLKLSREEFNAKYKSLGIKMNIRFKHNEIATNVKQGIKAIASVQTARDVQSTSKEIKKDYIELENPIHDKANISNLEKNS